MTHYWCDNKQAVLLDSRNASVAPHSSQSDRLLQCTRQLNTNFSHSITIAHHLKRHRFTCGQGQSGDPFRSLLMVI